MCGSLAHSLGKCFAVSGGSWELREKKLQLDLRTALFLAHDGTAATWAASLQHHLFCSP
jgi:hypothetical protein